jgi:hypothetical protein
MGETGMGEKAALDEGEDVPERPLHDLADTTVRRRFGGD